MAPPRAPGKAVVNEAVIRVRYAETDQMGVAYYSNYLVWFEIGRVELIRQLGFSYQEMEWDHYYLPVVEARCRYKTPALYDEALIIRTRLAKLRPSLILFGYDVIRQSDGELLAEGETSHIVVGPEKKKAQLPAKFLEPLRRALGDQRH
jgi:acyl-CoA thioester hydrolase